MNLKLIKLRVSAKKSFAKSWYWLMKPVANYFTTEKENLRYRKREAKITKELMVRYIAEDIAEYIVKRSAHNKKKKHHQLSFIIADYASQEDYNSLVFIPGSMMRRKKTRMAYHKFKRDIETQEAIIEKIGSFKGMIVEEIIEEFTWERIENYQKTVFISYEA